MPQIVSQQGMERAVLRHALAASLSSVGERAARSPTLILYLNKDSILTRAAARVSISQPSLTKTPRLGGFSRLIEDLWKNSILLGEFQSVLIAVAPQSAVSFPIVEFKVPPFLTNSYP
jgi:hypothetical protein